MKRSLVMCMPVFALAFGLSACGKSADTKTGGSVQPAALAAAGINTKFVSECGDVAAASTNAAFDLTQCQLSPSQLALLGGIGPFSVVADCVHQSVQIKNEAGEISGAGEIKPDGTYSVPLTVAERYNELENCPVKLEGLASGKVACDENRKLGKVDVNTTFTFSNVALEGASAVQLADAANAEHPASTTTHDEGPGIPGPGPGPGIPGPGPGIPGPGIPGPGPGIPGPVPGPGPGIPGPGPIQGGKGGFEKGVPGPILGKGGQVVGKGVVPGPIQGGPVVGKGGQILGKGVVPGPIQGGPVVGKGGQVLGKGGVPGPIQGGPVIAKGGQIVGKGGIPIHPNTAASHVDSCVSFSPCGFSTSVALSCVR